MKKIILIASIALSLTSCTLHTYRLQPMNEFTGKPCDLCQTETVSGDPNTYHVGQILPEGTEGRSSKVVLEVIK
jgi:hypothetical protein